MPTAKEIIDGLTRNREWIEGLNKDIADALRWRETLVTEGRTIVPRAKDKAMAKAMGLAYPINLEESPCPTCGR